MRVIGTILRQSSLVAVVALATWWIVFQPPKPLPGASVALAPSLALALTPVPTRAPEAFPAEAPAAAAPASEPELAPAPEPEPEPEAEAEAEEPEELDELAQLDEPEPEELAPEAPPAPELGVPEGDPQEEALAAVESEAPLDTPAEPEAKSAQAEALEVTEAAASPEPADAAPEAIPDPLEGVRTLMSDPGLLAAARDELVGEERRGFATVLLASPEDQLAIAEFFKEELVLLPRTALDPDQARPRWFRLQLADHTVRTEHERPPLERYRQYRDLFEYEYARLPGPLRELRRSVLARGEVYLFAALIPTPEWALVVGRRNEALQLSGKGEDEVRRFILRYVQSADGFDIRVEEIEFQDGARFRPRA